MPPQLLAEVGKHSMLYSSNALANHIQMLNMAFQKTQSDMDLGNEYLTTKAIYGAQVPNIVAKMQSTIIPPTSSAFGIMKSGATASIDGEMSVSKPVVSIGKTGVFHKRM